MRPNEFGLLPRAVVRHPVAEPGGGSAPNYIIWVGSQLAYWFWDFKSRLSPIFSLMSRFAESRKSFANAIFFMARSPVKPVACSPQPSAVIRHERGSRPLA